MFTSKNYKFDKNLDSYRNEVLKDSFTKYKYSVYLLFFYV